MDSVTSVADHVQKKREWSSAIVGHLFYLGSLNFVPHIKKKKREVKKTRNITTGQHVYGYHFRVKHDPQINVQHV
jgi:hypothetical protein